LTFEFDLESVKGEPACEIFMSRVTHFKSYCPNRETYTHSGPTALPGPSTSDDLLPCFEKVLTVQFICHC